MADVTQAKVVQQDLLNDEYRDRLGQLRTGLHDAKAEWNDLRGEQKVDDFGAVVFDKRSNHAERSQTQVLERTRFGSGVEKGIEEERDVCW